MSIRVFGEIEQRLHVLQVRTGACCVFLGPEKERSNASSVFLGCLRNEGESEDAYLGK